MTQARVVPLACTVLLLWAAGCPGSGDDPDGGAPRDGSDVVDAARPGPLITEFLASNRGGLTDEDGATSDWIEVHNPDSRPFDLSGYHLTDSKSAPRRWAFPEGTVLPPGGYLVVFASGKNRAVAGRPLHSNFSLSSGDPCAHKGGEYLALTSRDGTALPPVWSPFPAQSADRSYGLLAPSAGAKEAFFARPTPGAANDAGAALVDPVTISPTSRTFGSAAPLTVTLSVGDPSATIRYTTNRARPIDTAGLVGTFTPDAASDVCTLKGHGLSDRDLVRVTGPLPLQTRGVYFARVIDADQFQLTSVPGGPAIDLVASDPAEIRRDAASVSASAATDLLTAPYEHGLFSGDAVQVRTSGALPGGLVAETTYYVVVSGATSFRLSAAPTLTPIVDLTSAGSGALSVVRVPSPLYRDPLTLKSNTRVRARAFAAGRSPGPIRGEAYFAMDAAATARSSTLPIALSNTWNAAMPDNTVVDGYLLLFEPKAPDNLARLSDPPTFAAPCTLERHGSSTAGDPKFSMAVEIQDEDGIDQSCSPLGLPANADWLMHAPYQFDRSMMHNDLLYRLSNDIGRYAPRTRLIEHVHNEQSQPDSIEGAVNSVDYFGVYSFMDKITRGPSRVNVENLNPGDTDPAIITGGYMFKADRLDSGEVGIRPLPGQTFGGIGVSGPGADILAWLNPRESSPDPFKRVNAAQSDWLRAHLAEAWLALSGPNRADPLVGYARYFDVGALIDHHILNTATKNADAFRLSAYWHKPRMGKLTAGPVWDFDRAQGSTDGRDFDYSTWTASGGTNFFTYPWYREHFLDPDFWQAWIDRLAVLRAGPLATATINARIDELAAQLNPQDGADTPAKRSAMRWASSVPRSAGSNNALTAGLFNGQYVGEVAWLKRWWEQRLRFMDLQFTRPAEASLPAGKVAAGSIVKLSSPSEASAAIQFYYTLDGSDPRAPGGQPAAGARRYGAPIPINAATKLTVRAFDPAAPNDPASGKIPVGSGWSAPTVLVYSL